MKQESFRTRRNRVLIGISLFLSLGSPLAASAQNMADYTNYPVFLNQTVPPNILFIVDLGNETLPAGYAGSGHKYPPLIQGIDRDVRKVCRQRHIRCSGRSRRYGRRQRSRRNRDEHRHDRGPRRYLQCHQELLWNFLIRFAVMAPVPTTLSTGRKRPR